MSLFDGETLRGWKVSENPGTARVVEGTLACDGPRAHAYYVGANAGVRANEGAVRDAELENFDLSLEVRTDPGANSGVYFHTRWQDTGWPNNAGLEVQVNNTQPPFGDDYTEYKMTGSLYGVRNLYKALGRDAQWVALRIRVQRPAVDVWLNGRHVNHYVEPSNPPAGLVRLGKGLLALQCHDEHSRVQYRNVHVRVLPSGENSAMARPLWSEQDIARWALGKDNLPLVDLHTELSEAWTLEQALAQSRQTGIGLGIVQDSAQVHADVDAERFVATHEAQPVFAGLLATERGWTRRLTPRAQARFDYVVGQVTAVSTPEAFVQVALSMIQTEPIDVWSDPEGTGLGVRLSAAQTAELVQAAVRQGIALEVGTQHGGVSVEFVRRAKAAGARFSFGSQKATAKSWADWSNALQIVEQGGLSWRDAYVPGHAPSRAQRRLEAP